MPKTPRTPSHIPLTDAERQEKQWNERLPITTNNWTTTVTGTKIPRSAPETVCKPSYKLHDFIAFIRENATLEPETKALVYGLVEAFKEAKGKSR